MLDRRAAWLVFGLVVTLVVVAGCLVLAFVLPGLGAESGNFGGSRWRGLPSDGACPGCGQGRTGPGILLAPVGLLLLTTVPLGLLALLLASAVWFAHARRASAGKQARCANCERPVAADWNVCAYCGQRLERKA